ncbi:metalloprotease PmbA [Salinisphaera aquimarina]|uniref:Metalloprotease PmbA n=1 Tax=Salinisphaera aquimarina TaxID=2094031 RepID=A0ABV7EKI3_9GAMM
MTELTSTTEHADTGSADTRTLPDAGQLTEQLRDLLERARAGGADQAEASLSASRALSVSARARARESVEYEGDRAASITVYRDKRSGSASTTDLSAKGLNAALDQALTIARFTEADPYAGLADAELMAGDWPDLSLYHPWSLGADDALELALRLEAAALDHDPRIVQSEGATVASQDSLSVYGNSHGFVAAEHASRHALSCQPIARDGAGMQREVAFSQARVAAELDGVEAVGRLGAERALARLGARTPPTTTAPVLFTPRVARSLWGHLIGAISGGALYRDASFLKDRVDTRIGAASLTLAQFPHRPRGLSSTGFDADGVATTQRTLVEDGVLRGYLLSAYTARRLGLVSTGNAGGVFNLDVTPGAQDFDALVAGMGRGLVVTELMGQGVNLVNGDYSRGAAGFWVENGEIAYPVENATIAGNLLDMYGAVEALGNDVEMQSPLRTPSVLIGAMTIAGE